MCCVATFPGFSRLYVLGVFFTADSKSSAPSYKFCIKCLFVAASLQQLLRELPANIQQLFTLINTMTEDLLLMVNMSTGNSNRYTTSSDEHYKLCETLFVINSLLFGLLVNLANVLWPDEVSL